MALTHRLREIKILVRNVFAHEDLEEAPALEVRASTRRQFAASVFGREDLSLDPETVSSSRPGILSAIFGAEVLAEDPVSPPRSAGPGVLRALFAPEPLPELPVTPPRHRRAAWLRWLFRFERLDPP
jgi:hypothetical protein